MSNCEQRVAALFTKLDGAMAPNTIRAYSSDFAHFSKWCATHQVQPLECDERVLCCYVQYDAHHSKVATISRRLASLSSIFGFLGLPDPTKHTDLLLLLKKIKRQRGSAQLQAEPLTKDMIAKLTPFVGSGLAGQRNLVLLHLGHQTMRRRSELCHFTFSDICRLPGERYGIKLRFSKTDQEGKGKLLPITPELYSLLLQWRDEITTRQLQGGIQTNSDLILRGIMKGDRISDSLSPASINRILRQIQHRSDIETTVPFSGHSFRVGGALDLLMAGVPMEKIMLRGGWSSESTVIKYLRAWDLFS